MNLKLKIHEYSSPLQEFYSHIVISSNHLIHFEILTQEDISLAEHENIWTFFAFFREKVSSRHLQPISNMRDLALQRVEKSFMYFESALAHFTNTNRWDKTLEFRRQLVELFLHTHIHTSSRSLFDSQEQDYFLSILYASRIKIKGND